MGKEVSCCLDLQGAAEDMVKSLICSKAGPLESLVSRIVDRSQSQEHMWASGKRKISQTELASECWKMYRRGGVLCASRNGLECVCLKS